MLARVILRLRHPAEQSSIVQGQAGVFHVLVGSHHAFLPREDRVIYLRVPPAQAQALISQKAARDYTTAKQDIQESSLRHLEEAAAMYDSLSRQPHWKTMVKLPATGRQSASAAACTTRSTRSATSARMTMRR